MSLSVRLGLLLAVVGSLFVPVDVQAAEPTALAAARTRFKVIRKGDVPFTNIGTLNDTVNGDQFIIILLGTGVAKLTVADADTPGDTIRATGNLQTVFPVTFDVAATSPAKVDQNLPTTGVGILIFNVKFDNIVNGVPANYLYTVKF